MNSPDVPWKPSSQITVQSKDIATNHTIRSIGPDSGNFTYILVQGAGHFVVKNQREVVREIIERWITNVGWD